MKNEKIITRSDNIRSKFIILILISVTMFIAGCISPFEPNYKGVDDLLVVDGSLIKGLNEQTIVITRASSISDPGYRPVENCVVKIVDDLGNEFSFAEKTPGKYVASIDDALISYEAQYKLAFNTPAGEDYESDFQQILSTAPIDSVYCDVESQLVPDSLRNIEGLQFYADMNAPDDASKYYKWQIVETWEVHSIHKIFGIYDGKSVKMNMNYPADSLFYCWKTRNAIGFYTTSTVNLSNNVVKRIPLHFKLNSSQDLTIKYCATVRQFALNKDVYDYWHQKEKELKESGGIYTSQPNQSFTNICNVRNPEEKVLGLFWASTCSEKRIFVENPFNKVFLGPKDCTNIWVNTNLIGSELEKLIQNMILNTKKRPAPPYYIYYVSGLGGTAYYVAFSNDCIDCRLQSGTNRKPDFWK